jgi:low affinity Fe/Cu permease
MPTSPAANHTHTNGHVPAWFDRLAKFSAWLTGRPMTFLLSVGLIVVWLITGPLFGFSDTWQLVINTGTTIITFLMVFLIQNTQNRDTAAIHLKLDELIRALEGARNTSLLLEDASEEELLAARTEFVDLAEKAKDKLEEQGIEAPPAPECQSTPSKSAGCAVTSRATSR